MALFCLCGCVQDLHVLDRNCLSRFAARCVAVLCTRWFGVSCPGVLCLIVPIIVTRCLAVSALVCVARLMSAMYMRIYLHTMYTMTSTYTCIHTIDMYKCWHWLAFQNVYTHYVHRCMLMCGACINMYTYCVHVYTVFCCGSS